MLETAPSCKRTRVRLERQWHRTHSVDTDSDGSADITIAPKVGELVAYAPPAPASVQNHLHDTPAPTGSLPAWAGGAPLAQNPLPHPVATTSVATTSATTTVEQQTATSTLGVSEEISRVASAKAPMQSAPAHAKRLAPPARKAAPSIEVASAYRAEALSETPSAKNTGGMYHWLQTAWSTFIRIVTNIL